MFDIAWSEFLIVAVVALVVVGPRDLPALLRQVGKMVATVRKMAGEFQTQFNDALKEAELDDLRREVTGLKDMATKATGGNPFTIAGDELKKAMEGKPSDAVPAATTPAALAGETPEPAEIGADPVPSALAPESSAPAHASPAEPMNGAPAVPQPFEPAVEPALDPRPAAEPAPTVTLADAPPPPSDVEAAAPEPKPGAAS